MSDADQPDFMAMTADIVSAYVSNNRLSGGDLPNLITSIHAAIAGTLTQVEEPKTLSPAVPIKKSVTPDEIVCLEDGRKFKSLKRHLATRYGMTPDEYRTKWGLPKDYPMVAPNYAKARSELAKAMGLGAGRRAAAKTAPAKKAADASSPRAARRTPAAKRP